jgi:hypothetical protein
MNYTQWFSQNGKFQKHEQWLVPNLLLDINSKFDLILSKLNREI